MSIELWSKDIDYGVPADKSPDNSIIESNNGDAYLLKKTKGEKNVCIACVNQLKRSYLIAKMYSAFKN